MTKELTNTKLHKVLKKYRAKHEQHNREWEEICRKVSERNTSGKIYLPTIYQHEAHNSKGYRLFKDLMQEFEGYDVFPKK